MAYNSAEELTLLWRAMLVASGSGAVAESAAIATVEQCRPWSDQPSRLSIWQAGFAELDAEQERSPVQLLTLDEVGHRSVDVQAIADFLEDGPAGRQELLLGHHVGGFTGDDLRTFSGYEQLDDEQLADRISYESRVAAQAVPVKPEHWFELLSLVKCPVRFGPLVRRGSRSWRLLGIGAAITAVALLFLALFGFNRGAPPVVDSDVGVDGGAVTERSAGDGGQDVGPGDGFVGADLACSVVAREAAAIQVSPVYQRSLEVRAFSEVLASSDVVLRGPVAVTGLDGGDVRFATERAQVLLGRSVPPESFVLESRIDRAGGVVSSDELVPDLVFGDAIVFLRESEGRWEISETGGLWAGCGDGGGVPVGADWLVGPGWPQVQSPDDFGRVMTDLITRTALVPLVVTGERAVGGFQLFDGRSVVLEVPAGLEPVGPVDAEIQAAPDVLAFIDGPFLDLTLRSAACDPEAQVRAPQAVCSSDGRTMIEIGSPLNVSQAWLDRLDAHLIEAPSVAESDAGDAAVPVALMTRNDELITIDPVALEVRWRAPLAPRPEILAASRGEVLAASVDLVRAFDASTGEELWESDVDVTSAPVVVAAGWLIQAEAGDDQFLALVDGRTGELRWWTQQRPGRLMVAAAGLDVVVGQRVLNGERQLFGINPEDGRLLWQTDPDPVAEADPTSMIAVEEDRGLLATLDATGQLRLFELSDGRLRGTNTIPSAVSIDAISSDAVTINIGSGGQLMVSLDNGYMLWP